MSVVGAYSALSHDITFCQEQELDLENEVSPTVAQPPGTLFLPTSTTILTPVHSENDSRVYFMIVLTTDYCWRSWTCPIAAPYKFHVDWLIDILTYFAKTARPTNFSVSRDAQKRVLLITDSERCKRSFVKIFSSNQSITIQRPFVARAVGLRRSHLVARKCVAPSLASH